MKNTSVNNEQNGLVEGFNDYDCTLVKAEGEKNRNDTILKCVLQKAADTNFMSLGHKDRHYQRIMPENLLVTCESRSLSVPNSLGNKHKLYSNNDADCCDTQTILLPENESPPKSPSQTQELWFNTWPERNNKISADVNEDTHDCKTPTPSKVCDNRHSSRFAATNKSVNNILTLNEALQSISLAYSPLTKQLHYIENTNSEPVEDDPVVEDTEGKHKLGHHRTEGGGSFSSNVSSLSEPSSSGSLLLTDEVSPTPNYQHPTKCKKKGFTNFFTRKVFLWRSTPTAPVNNTTWNIFSKKDQERPSSPTHESIVASSSALIQHIRPSHLPAKNEEEEQRHRDEYMEMIAAAKKREAKNSAAKQKQHRLQLQVEDQLAIAARHWNTHILPKWDVMQKSKKTQELWWQGLPSSVRGKIWRLAIGNDLNLTEQLYEICVSRAETRLNNQHLPDVQPSEVDQESSLDFIKLDIARTFPNLCIFQEGGPYFSILHSLLAAYVCYRPDVGYVQGMSFIAAILILNMEQFDAFICFANLLNRPLHLAAYTLNQSQMQAYYSAYKELLCCNLPKLSGHFDISGLTPDLYLLDWVYTVFSKAMPLDVACRIWDLFLRDGEEFIFRTALGILHLYQDQLIGMDFLHGAQFLTRLPDDLSADNLFRSIQTISVTIGKQCFSQIVDRCKDNA